MRSARLALLGAALAAGAGAAAALAHPPPVDPADPVLQGDVIDPETRWPAEIAPGAPWVQAGPDHELGTADDVVHEDVRGDVDVVARVGVGLPADRVPEPAPRRGALPVAVAEPFGVGPPLPVRVYLTDSAGAPVEPPYHEGLPFLLLAFADLDGDGTVGVTLLDGDTGDAALEQAELTPVGRRYAIGRRGVVDGELFASAGGPAGAELAVAVAAAAFAGPFEDGPSACASCHTWPGSPASQVFAGPFDVSNLDVVPVGPAVTTRLPFVPRTDPREILSPGPLDPALAHPDGRVRILALPAWTPDPADPRFGESLTLHLDGRHTSIDVARVRSGAAVRFGLAQRPAAGHYVPLESRPLRPGLEPDGTRATWEILQRVWVPDDGPATRTALRVVALDQLGNVASPAGPATVTLRTGGTVAIVEPDADGDPHGETVEVADAAGAAIVLDDGGGVFDGADADWILVEAGDTLTRIDARLPDPDIDGSGVVDEKDLGLVEDGLGLELGDDGYEPALDLDANGRIDAADEARVVDALGAALPPDTAPGFSTGPGPG